MEPLALRMATGFTMLAVLVGFAVGQAAVNEAEPGFQVYHFRSDVVGTEFQEIFIVHAVRPGFDAPIQEIQIQRDGEPLEVVWEDEDGHVSINDTFWFIQEAFDQKQILTAHHGDQQVMSCRFGGGAGMPIHPQEWREMGQPEQVRCLRFTDDQ